MHDNAFRVYILSPIFCQLMPTFTGPLASSSLHASASLRSWLRIPKILQSLLPSLRLCISARTCCGLVLSPSFSGLDLLQIAGVATGSLALSMLSV